MGWLTGISENIRGSMLGAAESLGGTEEGKAKDEEIISKGRSEMEQGIAQMKGVTEPGGTAAGTESKVEGKIGEQPKPTELQGKTGDQSKSTESEGKTGDQPKPTMQEGTGDQAKPTMQEASSPAQAPPPLVPVQTADPQSLQAKPENSGKESASGTGYVQQSSQETQAGPSVTLMCGGHRYPMPTQPLRRNYLRRVLSGRVRTPLKGQEAVYEGHRMYFRSESCLGPRVVVWETNMITVQSPESRRDRHTAR